LYELRDAGCHVLSRRPTDGSSDNARLLSRTPTLKVSLGQAYQTRQLALRFLQSGLRFG
jgi:hypothetical protein